MTTKAQAFPNGAPPGARKIANNTWEWMCENGVRNVQLHRTLIFQGTPTGQIRINTGGFETVTTKARLNMLLHPLGYHIWQKNYVWYVESQHLKKSMPIVTKMVDLPQDLIAYHKER